MLIMKKDMGGAANVLALAQMVMARELKLRLRVLIPAVENSVAGDAFRPLDIYRLAQGPQRRDRQHRRRRPAGAGRRAGAGLRGAARSADRLGTLTGAARVALGPGPAAVLHRRRRAGRRARAPCRQRRTIRCGGCRCGRLTTQWLEFQGRRHQQRAVGGFAGSITCALFLQRFVDARSRWLHVDIYGWTPTAKPARPEGGECQAARALYALLAKRYG